MQVDKPGMIGRALFSLAQDPKDVELGQKARGSYREPFRFLSLYRYHSIINMAHAEYESRSVVKLRTQT